MNKRKDNFWTKHFDSQAGFNLSWGSVLAGVVTFFAVLALFSLITSAIGFGVAEPTDSDPMEGVGTGMIIWTVVSLVASMFAGGFVAGLAARRTGLLHGFLTWALSTVLLIALLTSSVFGAVGVLGDAIGSAAGLVADASKPLGDAVGDMASSAFDKASDEIGELDGNKLTSDLEKILQDTDVEELQPSYIQDQLDKSKEEIGKAGKDILLNPDDADSIIAEVSDNISARIEKIGKAADRDAIKNAVAENSDLSDQEADEAVDNIYESISEASNQASQQLDKAKLALEDAKLEVDKAKEEGKEVAEEATNAASISSILLFVGMLLALVITSMAGYMGSEKTKAGLLQE